MIKLLNFSGLRRVTSSGIYFPEIDGLRFISISLVLICHLSDHFFRLAGLNREFVLIQEILENGHNGVRIFFAISGCIIMRNALKSNDIKKYYSRRLIRIEPPYIICIIIIYFIIFHRNLYGNLNHLISSLFYCHSFVYNQPSIISPITWSLEVEIQFYLTFPVINAAISYFQEKFKIGSIIIIIIILFGLIYNNLHTPIYRTIFDNLTYFYTGVLFSYLSKSQQFKKTFDQSYLISIILFVIFILLFLINSVNSNIAYQLIYLLLIYFLFFFILNYKSKFRDIINSNFVSITGGMCYTIYLYHMILLDLFDKYIFNDIKNDILLIVFSSLLYLVVLWIISIILFILFEKPFMQNSIFNKSEK